MISNDDELHQPNKSSFGKHVRRYKTLQRRKKKI